MEPSRGEVLGALLVCAVIPGPEARAAGEGNPESMHTGRAYGFRVLSPRFREVVPRNDAAVCFNYTPASSRRP